MQSLTQGERQLQQPRRLSRTYKGFWLRFETDRRTSISVNCQRLDSKDPAAVEARADNEDYDDQHPTPPPPTPPQPQPPPLLPPLPPSGPTDLDFRPREAGEGLGRQEIEDLQDLLGKDNEREQEGDLWPPRNSENVDKTAAHLELGNDEDIDTHRRFEVSSTEERHVVTSGSAPSVARCHIFVTTSLSLWLSTASVLLLYRL